MTTEFEFNILGVAGVPIEFTLAVGQVIYLLGANGTGKSSLVSRLFQQHQQNAKRISAHRQTWFESNALELTARNRNQLETQFRSHDTQPESRYREWNPTQRASMAIYDLIDADTMQERRIAQFVRLDDFDAARFAAQSPSPIQVTNELMRGS